MDDPQVAPQLEDLLAHARWLRGLARSLVTDSARADDLSQETWLAALRNTPRDLRNPRAWLARTLRNVLHQRLRSERPPTQTTLEEVVESPDSAELTRRVEVQRMLAAEVLGLSEPFRSTLIYRYYEGLSSAEIARRQGVPAGTVRWRVQAALSDLRARLDAKFRGNRQAWLAALVNVAGRARSPVIGAALSTTGSLAMSTFTKVALLSGAVAVLAGLGALIINSSGAPELLSASPPTEAARLEEHVKDGTSDNLAFVDKADGEARTPVTAIAVSDRQASGVVVNMPDPLIGGEPAPSGGVKVDVSVFGLPNEERAHAEAFTGADGHFDFKMDDLAADRADLVFSVQADEKYRRASKKFRLPSQEPLTAIRLERVVHGDLLGQAVGKEGLPLQGVRVTLQQGNQTKRDVVSDDDGHFVFKTLIEEGNPTIDATKPGWMLADISDFRTRREGGWEPLNIVLGETAELAVTVLDTRGAPVEGAFVSADICSVEREGRRDISHSAVKREPVSSRTDTAGTALLEPIWAGKKLEVSVVQSDVRGTYKRMLGGRMLGWPTTDGDPIIIPPGTHLDLAVVVEPPARIRGRVVRADGSPVGFARVEVSPMDSKYRGLYSSSNGADAAGRFSFEVAAPSPPHQTVISALDALASSTGLAAHQVVAVSGRPDEDIEVVLVLAPTLSISGKVVSAGGQPPRGAIKAIASALDPSNNSAPLSAQGSLSGDGSFTISGLRTGTYDLVFEPLENYSGLASFSIAPGLAQQTFRDIEAGTSDLLLRLSDQELVHVEVEADTSERRIAHMTVLVGKPRASNAPAGSPSPARDAEFSSHHGWPLGPTLVSGAGSGAAPGSDGGMEIRYFFTFGNTFSLPSLEEGWYWIGVRAFDAENRSFFPAGTGRVYLTPGSCSFRFRVQPATKIEGVLVSKTSIPDLRIGLADQEGLLPLNTSGRNLDLVIEPGAAGDFVLDPVPIGTFSLRVGSEADLRAGHWLYEEAVDVQSETNPVIRIELP